MIFASEQSISHRSVEDRLRTERLNEKVGNHVEQDRYPLTYRAVEVRQVMNWVKAGQSGCIIALRGGGKSNI